MSDLHIPHPAGTPLRSSYRAARPGADTGTRRLLLAAGGLGALLMAGMGTWAFVKRAPTVVPVIEADTRPLRVKPDNPGGMQVTGIEDANTGAKGMAPAAEVPAPQALRAQLGTAAPPAPVTPAAPPATVAVPAPAAAAPAPAPRAVSPVSASAAATRAAVPGSATLVQLAAVDNEAAAQAEWQRLAKRMPDLLGDRRALLQKAERDGKPIWRVRTGGFADVADATGFCTRVRAKGGHCSIASF